MGISSNQAVRLICVSLSILVLACSSAFAAAKKEAPRKKEAVVATVNGSEITKADLDRAMKFMMAQGNAAKPLSAEDKKKAETAVVEQLVSAELLYQAGKKLEIKDVDKLVETRMAQNRGNFPTPAAYESALKESGLTEKDLIDFARKEIYINNLIEKEIASKATVSDDDTKKFYEANKEKFKHGEMVRASHILIGVSPKATADERKTAREKAEAALKRVKSGENFADAAKKDSTCPSSAEGGDLGYFPKGQMVPEFEKVAFSLKPGEISEVVETQFGYHVIKVVDKKPEGIESYDGVKEKIASFLKVQKIRTEINDYIEKLRKQGKVEIKVS